MDINGVPNVEAERVARYEYDGLPALDATQEGQGFRRIEKEVTANQGEGVVHHSDDGDMTGILAGERHEHYFWGGMGVSPVNWRLIETTNHVESAGSYSYDDSDVLNQFVYGTQYIDEPVRYDRNTDVGTDDDCVDADGSAAYFYHQDANWRVVMLTNEDGHIVERVEYTAYGEPTLYAGYSSGAGGELANALLVSTVGNPFMHQGLFRDRETLSYQNRFRQYDPRRGRFMQRDPFDYLDEMTLYGYILSSPRHGTDPYGLAAGFGRGYPPRPKRRLPSRHKCVKLLGQMRDLANKVETDLNLWSQQRGKSPKRRPPNTNYPDTCIDRKHVNKMNDNLGRLQKKIDEYNNSGCGNRTGQSSRPYQDLLDGYKAKWRGMPKEPATRSTPWWRPRTYGGGALIVHPDGTVEVILIPWPVLGAPLGAGAPAAAGAPGAARAFGLCCKAGV